HRIFCQLCKNFLHRSIKIDLNHIARNLAAILFRDEPTRFALELLEPNAIPVDLRLDITVGRTGNAHSPRTRRTVARQADDAHVQSEVFTAELRAVAGLVGSLEHLLFHLYITKSTPVGVA